MSLSVHIADWRPADQEQTVVIAREPPGAYATLLGQLELGGRVPALALVLVPRPSRTVRFPQPGRTVGSRYDDYPCAGPSASRERS
jgi:hypothetical protein